LEWKCDKCGWKREKCFLGACKKRNSVGVAGEGENKTVIEKQMKRKRGEERDMEKRERGKDWTRERQRGRKERSRERERSSERKIEKRYIQMERKKQRERKEEGKRETNR
jgi:hypothetical protein